jgi:2-methylcitrate dehydratase PrpD
MVIRSMVGGTRLITNQLVDNLIQTSYKDLPESTIIEAKRSLLNMLGISIGAAYHPSMDKVLHVASLSGGKEQITILGRKEKTDMLYAALLNGMSAHIFDFDDTLLDTVLHPSAPVYPAILSYAEYYNKSGKDVLEAFVLGCEVEARLAKALYPSHYWRGWHITGTVGTIGAAAAIAKLQGLDKERFSYAIGIAATEPTGLREMFGTMTKPFHPGKAAMNGLMAGLLAETGFTSSKQSLEAERGYGNVLSDDPTLEEALSNWGSSWEILNNSYKPFASGIVTHPAIDGAITIQETHNIDPANIKSIEIEVHPLVLELTGKKSPSTGLEGKFSVYHCVAVGLIDRKARVHQFSDQKVMDPLVMEVRDKVTASINDSIQSDQVRIKVTINSGESYEHFVDHAIGSLKVPMTNKQLEQKFLDVTDEVIPSDNKLQLIDQVWKLEQVKDIQTLLTICR